MTGLPGLPGSGSSSRPLGIVVMGADMICGGQFAFVEGVCREGFSGFSREKEGIRRIEEKKGVPQS